jgi:hypothetical protein
MKLGDIRMNYLKSISLADTMPTRLTPPSWTLAAILPGQGFPVRATHAFAVVTGFVGASRAGIALAGDGGLGEGGSAEEQSYTNQNAEHSSTSIQRK